MRIPDFIVEHPVEGLIGGVLLLLVLFFGSTDRHGADATPAGSPTQVAGGL